MNSTGDTVIYYYDAMGTKLRQIVIDSDTTGRYYFNGFEYNDTLVLDIIHNEEGYVSRSTEDYQYNYYLRDHLGNVRVVFTPASTRAEKLIQATDYYPFGMKYSTQVYVSGENNYLYNGKEKQDELGLDWYDYGARFYDPVIGRWHFIDPFLEVNNSWSPYNYALNNPIRYIDVAGLIPGDPVRNPKIRGNRASNLMGSLIRNFETSSHQGFDYEADIGTEVLATGPGKVHKVNEADNGPHGKFVILETINEDGQTVYVKYSHLNAVTYDEGMYVSEGDVLGISGDTGNAKGEDPHVHIEVWMRSEVPSLGLDGRENPNKTVDTDFVTQDPYANQTLTGVTKIEHSESGITKTDQNLDGTEEVTREPIHIEKLQPKEAPVTKNSENEA